MASISEFKIILKKQPKRAAVGYRPISIRLDVFNQIAYLSDETGMAVTAICDQLLVAALDLVEVED